MISAKRLRVGPLELQLTDVLILFALLLFSVLTAISWKIVENWWMFFLRNVSVAVIYLGLTFFTPRIEPMFPRFLLRVAAVTLAYAYLFGAVDKLQLIFHGRWLDEYVLDAEQYVFGVQPTLWLEHFITPWLTEWMMFSYVIYVPLYPILCCIVFYLHGDLAMEDYFFTLGLTNILCDLGFILFPVAGPIPMIGQLYTVPLDGYFFTYVGELMRSYLHYVGGTIPSPHCAAATIMWIMAYRYHRVSFYLLTPIILSLYVSTVYGRYHYATDAILGIGVAFLALAFVPILARAWESLLARRLLELSTGK